MTKIPLDDPTPEDNKVISLAEKTESSTMWSPEDALREALKDLEEGGRWEGRRKLIVLALDDEDGNYSVSYVNAGCKASEMLAILEIAKKVVEQSMGY